MTLSSQTIVALASAPGRAGVSVVRVSGSSARAGLSYLIGAEKNIEPRRATLATLTDDRTGDVIDRAVVLFFPAPNSFTGEDVVEFHIHGGRAVLKALLDRLCAIPSFTPAEGGDFSRRAFENGKMDLTEAEAIADLVDAQTSAQRRQALRQMDGELGRLYFDWADRLKHALAYIEAEIDFADEDVPADLFQGQRETMAAVASAMEKHLNDNHRGEKLREGFTIALLGAPNAGKSSLLNALSQREAAIVSPIPGTTRDVIEVQLDLAGYPVTLVDTAGLRETADSIESEGVRRALARAQQADLKLLIFDGGEKTVEHDATQTLDDDLAIRVLNKMDLCTDPPSEYLAVSAKTGEGVDALVQRLTTEIENRYVGDGAPVLTRARHRTAVEESLTHLRRAALSPLVELCAEDLRLAIRALGRITGTVDVEDVLDIIFSSFCIGK